MSLCPFHGRNYCLRVFLSPFLWRLADVSGPSVRIYLKRKFVFHFDDRHAMQRIKTSQSALLALAPKVIYIYFLCVVLKGGPATFRSGRGHVRISKYLFNSVVTDCRRRASWTIQVS